jgi:hypothetical protein
MKEKKNITKNGIVMAHMYFQKYVLFQSFYNKNLDNHLKLKRKIRIAS